MGVFRRLQESIAGGGEQTHSYRCVACRTTFESTARDSPVCPDCGTDETRRVVGGLGKVD